MGYRSSVVAQKLFSQHKKRVRETAVDVPPTDDDSTCTGVREKEEEWRRLEIYNLEGGIFQWACEEREIVNDKGEKMNSVHPYNLFWGKLLPVHLRHKF